MQHPVQLLGCLAGTVAGASAAWALRRHTGRPVGFVLRSAAALVAAIFALKLLPLFLPPEGFVGPDWLYPLWALWRPATAPGWIVLALTLSVPLVFGKGRLRLALVPVLWIALALTNGGLSGLSEPFRRDADYYADVARFQGLSDIWSHYEERQETLSLHGQTHPPGAVTLLWLLERVLGGGLTRLCLAVVLLSAAALLPVYTLARACLDRPGAEAVLLLWATTPAVALYGATCMDMIFALPLVGAAAAFAWGVRAQPGAMGTTAIWGCLSGLALGLGSLFTFSSALLAVTFLLTAALVSRRQPGERPRLTVLLATTGVTCVALLLSMRLVGFDWLACLDRAQHLDEKLFPATLSPSYWLLTRVKGVLDVLILAGPAAAALWLGGLRRRAFARPAEREEETAVTPRLLGVALSRAAAMAVLAFLLLGVYKIGETGRILLFLIPLVPLLAVARLQRAWPTRTSWHRGVTAVALLNLAQAFLFEMLLDTRW
ncbi:MAG TPA: glycosyltransferase family 39 protein [Candidatus Polarisedimenticolaceae bacterium]|nr:glycosyltransferase family 39 protein [Candidatus Polarisedimenticolaceae bacterium]